MLSAHTKCYFQRSYAAWKNSRRYCFKLSSAATLVVFADIAALFSRREKVVLARTLGLVVSTIDGR